MELRVVGWRIRLKAQQYYISYCNREGVFEIVSLSRDPDDEREPTSGKWILVVGVALESS